MAVTLISGVNGVGFTANPHVWSFSTDNTDPTTRIAIQVLIETAPYSDTWQFVGEYSQLVGAAGSCKFHLEDKLKAYLSWDVPTFFDQGVSVAPNICRRYKLRWGEYTSSDVVLEGTFYQTTGSSAWYDLPITLTSGAKYRLVAEAKNLTLLNTIQIDQDDSEGTIDLDAWELEHDRASYYLTPGATYTSEDILIPTGISIRLYSAAVSWSAYTDPEDRAVLLGGISFERFGKPLGPPAAATLLAVTASGEDTINGTFVDQTGGTAQHEVWYSDISATENFQLLETLTAGDNDFSDTTLSAGQTRWYKVRPINASATGLFSNVDSATTFIIWNIAADNASNDNAYLPQL